MYEFSAQRINTYNKAIDVAYQETKAPSVDQYSFPS